jgi:protein-L-isoaspartate(D-aspartate) O-methyltransferase
MVQGMIDTYRHKGLRKKLVEEIRGKKITDEAVLQAIEKIPRHLFMDNAFLEFAYQDKAFPIGAGQTISQPYTVAFQSQLLEVKKGDRILEIGTGSGYQTCVLLELGAKVFSIERQKTLYDRTRLLLPELGYGSNVKFFYGDGYLGQPLFAPYDKAIVTAGAPYIPEPLLVQLKVGGRLVIPVGAGDVQVMTLIIKKSETQFIKEELGHFRFVPLLNERQK